MIGNSHFLFFLLDIVSWIIVSIYVSVVLHEAKLVDRRQNKVSFITTAIFGGILGGLYATLDKGLPDTGFAFYNFLFASISALFLLTVKYSSLRERIINQMKKRREVNIKWQQL